MNRPADPTLDCSTAQYPGLSEAGRTARLYVEGRARGVDEGVLGVHHPRAQAALRPRCVGGDCGRRVRSAQRGRFFGGAGDAAEWPGGAGERGARGVPKLVLLARNARMMFMNNTVTGAALVLIAQR